MSFSMNIDMEKWYYIEEEKEDSTYRFILGEKGENPLVVFGINPSTATPEKLDKTMRVVKRLVELDDNNYDGYIMLNLYPQRTTDPDGLHSEKSEYAYQKNLEVVGNCIKELVRDNKSVDIWAAWGGNIDRRNYLLKSLEAIEKILRPYSVRWLERGEYKNPHHPLYLKKTLPFKEFDVVDYINKKKNNI